MNPFQKPRKQIKITIVVYDENKKILKEAHPDVTDMVTAYKVGRKLKEAYKGDDYEVLKRV